MCPVPSRDAKGVHLGCSQTFCSGPKASYVHSKIENRQLTIFCIPQNGLRSGIYIRGSIYRTVFTRASTLRRGRSVRHDELTGNAPGTTAMRMTPFLEKMHGSVLVTPNDGFRAPSHDECRYYAMTRQVIAVSKSSANDQTQHVAMSRSRLPPDGRSKQSSGGDGWKANQARKERRH